MPVFRVVVEVRSGRLPSLRLGLFDPEARSLTTALLPPASATAAVAAPTPTADERAGRVDIEWMDDTGPPAGPLQFTTGHTEVAAGVLHLFRTDPALRVAAGAPAAPAALPLRAPPVCDLAAILAVPAYLSSADLLQFLAEQQSFISAMRVLRYATTP
jgi:hypothetical protein